MDRHIDRLSISLFFNQSINLSLYFTSLCMKALSLSRHAHGQLAAIPTGVYTSICRSHQYKPLSLLISECYSSSLSLSSFLLSISVFYEVLLCLGSSRLFFLRTSSLATLLRFLREILPVSSSSKSLKARAISSAGSRSKIFCVTREKKRKKEQKRKSDWREIASVLLKVDFGVNKKKKKKETGV